MMLARRQQRERRGDRRRAHLPRDARAGRDHDPGRPARRSGSLVDAGRRGRRGRPPARRRAVRRASSSTTSAAPATRPSSTCSTSGHRRDRAARSIETDWTTRRRPPRGLPRRPRRRGHRVDERADRPLPVPRSRRRAKRIGAARRRHAPTAIFAANNLLAEQAWQVIRRAGLGLPADISLVGFDDVPWMEMVEPGDHGRRPADLRARPLRRRAPARRLDEPDRARASSSCSRASSSAARPGRPRRRPNSCRVVLTLHRSVVTFAAEPGYVATSPAISVTTHRLGGTA